MAHRDRKLKGQIACNGGLLAARDENVGKGLANRIFRRNSCRNRFANEGTMKLKDMEVIVVGTPPPGWGGRYFIFVKVTTDNGIVGWGEVYAAAVGPKAMTAVIEDVFSRHMQGENPENVEMMFRRAYSSGFTQRPDPTVIGAFSGLEIACWDILGKAHGRPVHALLGGMMNDRVRSYTYLYPLAHQDINQFWGNADMAAECAAEMVRLGFTAVKFDPAGPYTLRGGHQPAVSDIAQSVEFCRKIRAAVGSKADLLFGTHGQFTTSGAIRLGRQLEEFDPLWFEEPMPPDNIDEFRRVADAIRIPIATGERMTTKVEFAAALRAGVSILQPALGRSGGILETKKIAAIAEVHNAQVAPHLYAGPVEWAANIQLAINIPNHLITETIQTGGAFHLRLIKNSIKWEAGYIIPPTEPGLGIEFDEALARAHPYTGSGLHLEMQEAPCDYSNGNTFLGGAPPVV
jgi:galactonate dehydratase